MPAHRLPQAVARTKGAIKANPSRFADRTEPKTDALGAPSPWISDPHQLQAWSNFTHELPWLAASDRAMIELACTLRGRLIAGEELTLAHVQALRQILGALGASPADRSKVPPVEAEKPFDPTSIYLS
jgi:hypothetical protein